MRTTHIKFALLALATTSLGLGGCAYKSFYRQTDFKTQTQPVPAADVKVVANADRLTSEWKELGNYAGRAPTVKEAMGKAQEQCGQAGANLYVLHVEPYQSSAGWNIDGACGYAETLGGVPKKKKGKKKKGKKAKKAAAAE